MVSANTGLLVAGDFELSPRKGRFVHIQAPHVIHWLGASVSTEHQQVRLIEYDRVAIPAPRRLSNHWHNHPLCSLVAISEI
jgi:hypothetical protein